MNRQPPHERGAALLTVLILVGVMGAIAVAVFDRLRLATMLAGNAAALESSRSLAMAGEALVTARIDDLAGVSPGKTLLAGGWLGRPMALPLPGGTAEARVTDGGNCFNLNSLATGNPVSSLVTRPVGVEQFATLMRLLGLPQATGEGIAAAAADWIDTDDAPNRGGAEDTVYQRADPPYRAANTLMAEPSELRAVAGVTPEIYAQLRPWLCALPVAELSPINVNTLLPAQAPLLAMMLPGEPSIETARRAIAERPVTGWNSRAELWATPALSTLSPGAAAQQPQVKTSWFALAMQIDAGTSQLDETALVDARQAPARLASRRWTGAE
jgi:general secretion pathway protein K